MTKMRTNFFGQRLICTLSWVLCLVMSGCGGGNGSPAPTPVPAGPDFAVTVQPTSVSVTQGSSSSLALTITPSNGFNSQVNVSLAGLPAGVAANPAQFSVAINQKQTVVIQAITGAVVGQVNLSVTATSGSLTHTSPVSLSVTPIVITANPPLRMEYVRTDAQWELGYLNFAPQHWILYHAPTKRFFISNTNSSRIEVFSAATESKIADIPVPNPWAGDESPDHSTIYMATKIGDLYQIDPVTMTVTKRILSSQIGPTGFAANVVRVLADGKLAILGTPFNVFPGGLPFIHGYQQLTLWDPVTNSTTVHGGGHVMELTADRTKILLLGVGSVTSLTLYDPATNSDSTIEVGSGPDRVSVPPDGKEFLIPFGNTISVYDSTSLALIDQFQIGNRPAGFFVILSTDGNTLFALDRVLGTGLAVDWRTHVQKGILANYTINDAIGYGITPMAVDETGLIAGVIGQGIGFIDGGALLPAQPALEMFICCNFLQPTFGPAVGGTPVQETGAAPTLSLAGVYFGNRPATQVSVEGQNWFATSPAGQPGPVNVKIAAADGGIVLLPDAFNYGPSIVELTTNVATAEGGATGTLFGYGLTDLSGNIATANLQLKIGANPASIISVAGPNSGPFVFPLEVMSFVMPPGTAGTPVSVTVSNSVGTFTQTNALTYLPAVQTFPLPGASLAQGIYDPLRDRYYFTDQNQIQVFSLTQAKWLSPVLVPNAVRLWGLSLSPDGSKLAVGDAGTNLIYLFDPATLAAPTTFTLPNTGADQGGRPSGLAITDTGIVYYDSFYLGGSGQPPLHKLDTTTGIVFDYPILQAGLIGNDQFVRVLLSKANSTVSFNLGEGPIAVDTATDSVLVSNALFNQGDYELAVAGNQVQMTAASFLLDTSQNAEGFVSLNDRESENAIPVLGEKLSTDGTLLFRPMTNGVDVFDARTGTFRHRIPLSISLSPMYDALVANGKSNVLIAITGATGNGIAILDLRSLPMAPSLPF